MYPDTGTAPAALAIAPRRWLLLQDDVGGVIREGVLRARVAEDHHIDAGEERLAPAENRRGNHEVDLVGQPGGEVLANGRNASAEPDVLARGRLFRTLERGMDAIG